MKGKPRKTLVDYLVILISPLLIMLLVGSLVYFLLEIGYEGRWENRLKWVMFWFVIGSVLIGRIAIERGSAIAGFYALGLAGALGAWTNKFMGPSPLIWFLLAFIWWFTHMLTRDCTLIEDDEDASGEGLLQASGLEQGKGETDARPDETSKKAPARPSWWHRWLPDFGQRKGQPHAPGKWLIWFSLLALPVFGFGSGMIPESDSAGRSHGFKLLGVYVLAALCLLMNTSFLGLRRYLRQRRLRMPMTVTGLWLMMGTGIIVAILAVALILPRPDANYDVTALIDRVAEKVQEASDRAFLDEGTGTGDSKQVGENEKQSDSKPAATERNQKPEQSGTKPGNGDESNKQPTSGKGPEKDGKQPGASPDSKPKDGKQPVTRTGGKGETKQPADPGSKPDPEKQSGKSPEEPKASGEKSETTQSPEPTPEDQKAEPPARPPPTPAPQWIGTAFKVLLYLLLIGIVLFFLIRHRHAIAAALRRFWTDLMALFGRKPATAVKAIVADEPVQPARPFGRFRNPFTSGEARLQTPEQLVNYTYQAMEAWAFEKGFPRTIDQTPNEFARSLGESIPELASDAPRVTRIYSTLAYTNSDAPNDTHETMARLWDKLW